MAGGRPPKFRPLMCKKARECLAKGYSKRATAGILGIHEDTLLDWSKKYPEFSCAIKEGLQLGEKLYIDRLVSLGTGSKGYPAALIFIMKNLYKWSDNPVVDEREQQPLEINFISKKKIEDEDD